MIGINDYTEMNVKMNGTWQRADVLKKLDDGTCLILMGNKLSNGDYMAGGCIPAEEYKEIPKFKTVVKSAVAIMTLLVEAGYNIDVDNDWMHPDEDNFFDANMWKYCGKENTSTYTFRPEWLEEIEITPEYDLDGNLVA